MRLTRLGIALVVAVSMLLVPRPAAAATLLAIYQVQPPASASAGSPIQVPVTVSNAGTETWNATGASPVNLSYHWTDLSGQAVVWDGSRTPLGGDVAPNASRQVIATIATPTQPGTYILSLRS